MGHLARVLSPILWYFTLKSNSDLTGDQILYPAGGCPVGMLW